MYNVEALKELRAFLIDNYEMVSDHLDFEHFACTPDADNDSGSVVLDRVQEIVNASDAGCLTSACMAGWAIVMDHQNGALSGDAGKSSALEYSRKRFINPMADSTDNALDFLFSCRHDNDLIKALVRLDYAIARNDYTIRG